jgi:hypothetical protein
MLDHLETYLLDPVYNTLLAKARHGYGPSHLTDLGIVTLYRHRRKEQ